MTAPEVRLAPTKRSIAYRFASDHRWTVQTGEFFERYVSDAEVSDWTPLLPASNKDGES